MTITHSTDLRTPEILEASGWQVTQHSPEFFPDIWEAWRMDDDGYVTTITSRISDGGMSEVTEEQFHWSEMRLPDA
jgi:hypothetical protein